MVTPVWSWIIGFILVTAILAGPGMATMLIRGDWLDRVLVVAFGLALTAAIYLST